MITVSESALGQLKGLVAQQDEPKVGLRVFIQSGGCSGFSYGMGLDESPPLEGAEIDYVDALMGGGFTIHNPNATRTCGCGHSFQPADGAGEASACSH